jgi:hypothetical protein
MTNPTLQARCVWCDIEHRDFEIVGYSAGDLACGSCSRYSAPMIDEQYRMCRWAAFDRTGHTVPPCYTCGVKPPDLGQLLDHLRQRHPLPVPEGSP